MPEIYLPDDLYERLGRLARPFEIPADVIQRLVDEKEDGQARQVPFCARPGHPRKPRPDSLRGAVTGRWEEAGRPKWDIEEAIRVCEDVDEEFQQAGKNPAPRFREGRSRGDTTYIRAFVYGYHFQWLNPR